MLQNYIPHVILKYCPCLSRQLINADTPMWINSIPVRYWYRWRVLTTLCSLLELSKHDSVSSGRTWMSFTTLPALDVEKAKGRNTNSLCQNLRDRFRKKRKRGYRGILIWPALALLQRTKTPSSGSCLSVCLVFFYAVEYLLKMFYLNFSLEDYLEATLRTEIYSWIAWGTNSLYHLLQLPIYFWGQSGCSLVIELKQRGTSFVPTQWPGSVSEWMLHGNGPFLFTSTGIWERIVAPTSFH